LFYFTSFVHIKYIKETGLFVDVFCGCGSDVPEM
jgi:hypothetical protein